MYRAPDQTPRCASCGGTSLTPATKFDPSDGFAYVWFRDRRVTPTVLGGDGTQHLAIDRARVCLDCGHVMLGFSDSRLAELRAVSAAFEPVAS